MADFTGMRVRMTLKDGFIVEGTVNKVVPEHQTLMLQNGKRYASRQAVEMH
jgi:hypothetical protein